MDAVTIGAVLLAILGGAGSQLGTQLWTGMSALVRRPFQSGSDREKETRQKGHDRTGETELLALERVPDESRALHLAEILLERAASDLEFGRELENWWDTTRPVRDGTGTVPNAINVRQNYGVILQGDFRAAKVDITVHSSLSAPVALAQLPPPVAGFTGRDAELETLLNQLKPTQSATPVVTSMVAGMAGAGKTALAVQAGHIAVERGWCTGGQLVIDLHGYDDNQIEPNQALDALLRALGVAEEHIPADVESRASFYRSTLASVTEPILIIADNASSEAQVRPLLSGIGPHRLIVTSRNTLADLGARILDIAELDDHVGAALIDASLCIARPGDSRIAVNQEGARRLAQACGGLPLALQIAAALMKSDPNLEAAELAEILAVEHVRLQRLRYDDGDRRVIHSVEAAFELSYRRLDPAPARLFRLLPINPGPDISASAAAVLAELPFDSLRSEFTRLVQAHLVEAVPREHGRWRMHDLVRLYAQQLSEQHARADRREEAIKRLLNHYTDTTGVAVRYLHSKPSVMASGPFKDREAAVTWLDSERRCLVAAITMAAARTYNRIAFDLSTALWPYLDWRRRFDDMLSTATASLDAARLIGDNSNMGKALNTLGIGLWRTRRLDEAIAACQNAVAIFAESGQRHWEGRAQTNLGIALREANKLDEAIGAHRKAVAIFRQVGDRRYEAVALTNLGSALRNAGRSADAVAVCRSAAVIFHDIGDLTDEGSVLGSLGRALISTHDFEGAVAAHRRAISNFEVLDDVFSVARAKIDLGVALQHAKLVDDAIRTLREAVLVFRGAGDRHFEGIACSKLCIVLQDAGKYDLAAKACKDAADAFQETGEPREQAIALTNQATALERAGHTSKASNARRRAAKISAELAD